MATTKNLTEDELITAGRLVKTLAESPPEKRAMLTTAISSYIDGLTAGEALAQKPAEEPA